MNICILSMQRVNNFGSLLQAYSLKKILENEGHNVYFIDIEKKEEDNILLDGFTNNFSNERESKANFLSKIKKIDKYAINRLTIKNKVKQQNINFEAFRNEYLEINKKLLNEKYDICVIGSDEVFNALSASSWGFTSQLFGNVNQAKKVITYAASCGATTYEKVPEKVRNKIKDSFKKVLAFSVRDENTKKFVEKISNKDVNINLDPVVIGNFDDEMEKNNLKNLPKHYCIVYSYYNRMHNKSEIEAIKKFCKLKKMELITVGAPQFWISNHLVLNPFEMLNVFKNADFVITDTFHGSIFAAKYTKKFATIIRESNKNKLSDLLRRLNVENHLLSDINDLENIYLENNDTNKLNEISKKQKDISIQYFRDILKEVI